jgi:D-xylonolactonase
VSAEFETLAHGYGLVEGPTVDPEGGIVFSDVLGGGIYRLDPSGEVETLVPKRRGVGGIALHADGGVVISGRDIVHVREGVTRTVFSVPGLPGWNDLCTDASGRVYAGSLRFAVFERDAEVTPGECWRIDAEGSGRAIYEGVLHANGIGLSPDGGTIYHSDTRAGVILVHDLDARGHARGRREWATEGEGRPDGLAIDEDGGVWVASAGGGRVDRYQPDGTLVDSLSVPAHLVTSCCFAGGGRRELIVVTADNRDHPERKGTVFKTAVDVAGAPVFPARV